MPRDYIIAAVAKAVKVEDYLAKGDILEWKTPAEVAAATGLTRNEAFRILATLEKCGRVKQGEKGYRIHQEGLVALAAYASEYVSQIPYQIGLRR